MTSSTLVLSKSSLPTTPSTSPVIKRYGSPYALINTGTKADNVLAIVERVIHAHLPVGYTEVDDILRKSEANPRRAAALSRARQRLAGQLADADSKPTLSTLRLRAGLSQTKVAELLGNSQSSYSMIESGKRSDIFHSTFEKLVELFDVSRDELADALKNIQENRS